MFRSCSNLHRLSRLYSVINIHHPLQISLAKWTKEASSKPTKIWYKEYSVIAKSNAKNVESVNQGPLDEIVGENEARIPPGASINTDHSPEVKSSTAKAGVEDQDRKLKILKLEVSVLRQEGRKVPDPDLMKPAHWDNLMQLASKSARSKYYTFLWSIERKKESTQAKKTLKREEGVIKRAEKIEEMQNNDHIIYSLSHTSFLLRIYLTTMNHWHNNKLTRAMQFGQKLVLDCSYDQHMTTREAINAAKQLMFCFAENRYHDEPFDLYFCNANPKSTTMRHLHSHIPTMMEPHFPLNVHEASYLDIFPKDQLVYLTPHCKTDLIEFNPNHIYIVGAMVDTVNNEPLSLAKAKREGIRMARLPLDRYLQWGAGSGKSLTLNQMTHILLDLKKTGNWAKSLEHVPRRKLVNETVESQQHQREQWVRSMDKFRIHDDRKKESSIENSVTFRPPVTENIFSKANYKPEQLKFKKRHQD